MQNISLFSSGMLHCVSPLPTINSVPLAMGASCSNPINDDDSDDSIPFYKAVEDFNESSDKFFLLKENKKKDF